MTGPVDIDALDAFLMSDAAPDDGMGLSDLDGFLTGIVVGPEPVMPSEWLPLVWGGKEPAFESEEQARSVLSAIMGRYNEIARALDGGRPGDLDPIYWEHAENGTVIAADWAEGFLDAIKLRADAWAPLLQDRDASALLTPILGLCGDEDGGDLLPLVRETRAKLVAEAPNLIPACVFGIRLYWRGCTGRASPARPRPKPGRNEPCPCGSGRKHKRCCGAN